MFFIRAMLKGESERSGEECSAPLHMLGALLRSLILSPSLAASGFIRSPVTTEPWPGAPATPEGFTPHATFKASDINKPD